MTIMTLELTVLTLNVWGIPFVASDREARIAGIATELNTGNYDIVSLQEVWSETDCRTLKEKTQSVLPYWHYFHSGVIGAGLLVLSKHPIIGALFHAWSVNGYFHRIQHADWFGGKGVGLCRIRVGNRVVHLYNAHLHAEYDNENDEYITHRVIQAFDTAQFIETTRGGSMLQILAGDLNTRPQDLTYKVLLFISKMQDCCASELITTNECHRNSYTSKRSLAKNPLGIRIDHIFMRSANHISATVLEYTLPLPDRVPGQKFSFSDHEAVLARLRLSTRGTNSFEGEKCASGDFDSTELALNPNIDVCDNLVKPKEPIFSCISVLTESIALCETSLQKLKVDRIIYYSIAVFLCFLLLALVEYTVPTGFKTLYLLLKFLLFGMLFFCIFMGSIWNFMERKGILSGKTSMEIMLSSFEKHDIGLEN